MDFLTFKSRVTQNILPLTYWLLTILTLYSFYNILSAMGRWMPFSSMLMAILGMIGSLLTLRIVFEFFLNIHDIHQSKNDKN